MSKKIYVCISLDVEEEGLFSGKYAKTGFTLHNVPLLKKLAPLSIEMGFPLTLFCAYPVFCDPKARETIQWMHKQCNAEIGAHLHHWSTPPFDDNTNTIQIPARTHLLDKDLFKKKLTTLVDAAQNFTGQKPESFRMGRWDLKKEILPILSQSGILVDSSICPLRAFKNGADHFLAPASPYWVKLANCARILEAPITQIPVIKTFSDLWHKTFNNYQQMLDSFHFFGAISPNPFWHNPVIMRLASIIHRLRGGEVLNLFWHSSEMMPKGSPHIPDQAAADAALAKIFHFCKWLKNNFEVEGVTCSQLARLPISPNYPMYDEERKTDW